MPPLRWTVLPQVSAMRSIAPSGRSARSCAALSGKIEGQRRARVAAIEPTLEQALQESPPPSLRQVTKRLGFSATCVLKAHAPDLYERLKTHWQAYARIRRTELQNKLKAVLQEKPPPSLRSVYSRQGVTESIVNTSFPDLRREIGLRHLQYQRQQAQGRRDEVRAEIHEIVRTLHAQGICPSSATCNESAEKRLAPRMEGNRQGCRRCQGGIDDGSGR